MTTQDTTQRPALRSQRLNQITHEPHSKLDALVKAHAPFETQANFARFVVAQYLFQSELVALYNDAELTAIIPDLPARCRAEAAKATWRTWTPTYRRRSPVPLKNPSKAAGAGLALRLRRFEAGRGVPDQARRGPGPERDLRCPSPRRTGRWPCGRLEKLRQNPGRP